MIWRPVAAVRHVGDRFVCRHRNAAVRLVAGDAGPGGKANVWHRGRGPGDDLETREMTAGVWPTLRRRRSPGAPGYLSPFPFDVSGANCFEQFNGFRRRRRRPTAVRPLMPYLNCRRKRRSAQRIKGRILGGLLLLMPILITIWVFHWLYSTLATKVIDPLALLVIWKVRQGQTEAELPEWFEDFAGAVDCHHFSSGAVVLLGFLCAFAAAAGSIGCCCRAVDLRRLRWRAERVSIAGAKAWQAKSATRGAHSVPASRHARRGIRDRHVLRHCHSESSARRVCAAISAADQRAFATRAGRGSDRAELGSRPDVANFDFRRDHGARRSELFQCRGCSRTRPTLPQSSGKIEAKSP